MEKSKHNFWIRFILGTIAMPFLCLMLLILIWFNDQSFAKALIETGNNFLKKENEEDASYSS